MPSQLPRASVRVSVMPNEVVLPTASFELVVDEPIDLDATRLPLAVDGAAGKVDISDDGRRVRWAAREPMRPGWHRLVVDPLVGRDGSRLGGGFQVPFRVADLTVPVPKDVAIEAARRVRIDELTVVGLPLSPRPEGSFIDIIKGVRRDSGEPVEMAADEQGHEVDFDEVLNKLAAARHERFGKLDPALHEALQRQGDAAAVRVAIWLRVDERVYDETARLELKGDERSMPPHARRQREMTARVTAELARQLERFRAREIRRDRVAPVVYAVLPGRAIRELAQQEQVAGVFLYDPEGVDDLDDSIDAAGSATVHGLGFTGSGARVAVWERGPDSTADLDIEDSFDSSPTTSQHSRHVHGIIKNTERRQPNGHAPDCLLHSANSYDLAALEWAVEDRTCRVINQSFHRTAETTGGDLSYDDIYKDWLALHWPYPFITQAAGNTGEDGATIDPPSDEFVNHKGYNSLTVGNHNDDGSAMSATSVFRNPNSPHGDRELPELCANGTSVRTVGLTMSGTSMASPAVAGAAALLHDTNPMIRTWPEACRAILLAGATRNVTDDTWWRDVLDGTDAADGSGALNALESHRIAQVRRGRNNVAARRGWDAGRLTSSDFGSNRLSTFTYRVRVPGPAWWLGPRRVKVALAWTSQVLSLKLPFFDEMLLGSYLTVDLDLQVVNARGDVVASSASWDNSYEIAEFDGTPGETYEIRIRRWSGRSDTWYGIAWTVTGGLLLTDLLQGLRTERRSLVWPVG